MIKKILYYLKHPKFILLRLDNLGMIRLSDKYFISLKYLEKFEKKINLKAPKTFNEKLQWIKLNDRKNIYTTMVDKYEAKKFISNIIGNEYIIPTIGIYDNFDEINFDYLPNKFVIKCTHYSGDVIICNDKKKFDILKAKIKINKILKKNLFYFAREWPYKNLKPRIIIEELLENPNGDDLKDYKIFCFNGKAKLFKIDFDRFTDHRANYYDLEKKILPFGEEICPPDFDKDLLIPKSVDEMMRIASILSKDTFFLRVDFYEVHGKIYFGELTFFPAAGFGKFIPEDWDKKLGDLIELPKEK
mgnify:CR=1 FL=1